MFIAIQNKTQKIGFNFIVCKICYINFLVLWFTKCKQKIYKMLVKFLKAVAKAASAFGDGLKELINYRKMFK